MATKSSAGSPSFNLPDGQPIAAEAVEAELKARVTACEAALEDAVWQLARFYSMVGRPGDSTACVARLLAGTPDPEKHAAGYLALAQLLEQRRRYAEAAVAYATGLEGRPARGEVGYFLHNNRGYCLTYLGQHIEAEIHCRTAIEIDPRRHNAHKNLGLALAGQRRVGEAARALLEADRRCPADGRARRHLAELLTAHAEVLQDDPALESKCRERGLRIGPVGNA